MQRSGPQRGPVVAMTATAMGRQAAPPPNVAATPSVGQSAFEAEMIAWATEVRMASPTSNSGHEQFDAWPACVSFVCARMHICCFIRIDRCFAAFVKTKPLQCSCSIGAQRLTYGYLTLLLQHGICLTRPAGDCGAARLLRSLQSKAQELLAWDGHKRKMSART